MQIPLGSSYPLNYNEEKLVYNVKTREHRYTFLRLYFAWRASIFIGTSQKYA